jgi:hypothetical protein
MKKHLQPWQDRVLFAIFLTAFCISVILVFGPPSLYARAVLYFRERKDRKR